MVEWWKGAAATISGVATFCWSVHYWNEGYRQVSVMGVGEEESRTEMDSHLTSKSGHFARM